MEPLRPLVTVIVPNYNHARFLPLCLQAIKEQTYSPMEIVVVDDHSTDESVRIAESMGVNVIRTPANGGAAVARNTGAAWASGDILFFVDSDVALAPDAVAVGVALLEKDPNLGAACGIEDPEPLIRSTRVEDYRALQHHYWSIASEGEVSFLWSAMFAIRAAVFAEVGPFNPRLRHTEEVDYGHRLSRRHTVLITSAIHGRMGHDRELGTLLRKLFHRGRLRVPLYARRRRFAQGYETASRAWGSVAALLAVAALPVPLVFGPVAAAVPALLLAASLACDAGMYRFVFSRRCPLFGVFFAGVHFLVNLVIIAGVAAGAAQWFLSGRFRGIYDAAAPAALPAGG
ncbi:glycosyltransferase family 2 protein [Planotetraspora sp. A-T 1434]|uniref:glycosyltransferase family 2 protein n=1 Tax=Planotetraspora sp. A-T 1434 TaxID=2979219 RepID=UPI0021C1EE54|nr:glycosyltransferase family A protein [Planotetraspora sp. A-T 1434]MCT9929890.1 glycosyltransferase family 2 protein [Planotetraspora sp. A-T 1434]